jgi:hypothetical protein
MINALILLANLVGGWFLFFTYGARPDGVVPGSVQVLRILWLAGPFLAIASLAGALLCRASARQRRANALILAVYTALWGFLILVR